MKIYKTLFLFLVLIFSLTLSACQQTEEKYSKGLVYELSEDGSYYIVAGIGTCTDNDIVFPSTHKGLPVKEIKEYSFGFDDDIYSLLIPEGVEKIGASAFKACTELKNISFPSTLLVIESEAFSHCIDLKELNLPKNLVKIGSLAFEFNMSLEKVIIPLSVTEIGSNAFKNDQFCTIYCEVESEPSTWDSNWNEYEIPVVWGYTE